MEEQDAINPDTGEPMTAQRAGGGGEDAPPETFDLDMDGTVHTLPAALKGAFLRQADYTRKTQELAQHRRAVIVERQALAAQAQGAGQASHDQVQLAALDHQLGAMQGVDWEAYAAQDPDAAKAMWERFQELAGAREKLAYAVSHHLERRQMEDARQAAAKMAETGRTLQSEIEGWSPEVAGKLIDYAKAFGVTNEELSQMADPRLWKLLHKAHQADQARQDEGAASSAARAQAIRPAVLVSGAAAGGGGVRDELATKEWMTRRNEQTRTGR